MSDSGKPRVAFVGGAGTVGSSAAFRVAELGVAGEIVLIDARPHMARSHVMDLEQAVSGLNGTRVTAGAWEDLAGSDVVVLSASLPERNVASRDEYLTGNVAIVQEAALQVRSFCPDAVVLVATNPIDVFTYVFAHLADLPPERVIGYSWNDSLRLRWAVAAVLGVPVPDVEALVLGEHGDGQVPLFDRVTVRSQPVVLTPEQRGGVEEAVRGWFTTYQGLQSGRTSGWTSAVGIGEIVRAIASASPQLLPCSAILRGQYGLREVSLGVPVRLGPRGVRQIEELPLTEADLERLHAAARKVRAAIAVALGVAAQQGAA